MSDLVDSLIRRLLSLEGKSHLFSFSVDDVDDHRVFSGGMDEFLSRKFSVLVAVQRVHDYPRTRLCLGVGVTSLPQTVQALTIAPAPTIVGAYI